ncbi:fasciclin domain-containing protein [Carboxylicivirga sp. N1Y90]|uniref:fasciclin domain-containing protein n=1 Tax=Carboxylicivirga fragile TaxID=3417571 RepID=UPI003D352639|nr:fasciclin domain-containing protein [Marinilabiliaceae bacterium N1Y90]
MKTLKRNLLVVVLFGGLLFVNTSCNDDDDTTQETPMMEKTITQVAASDDNFSILVAALQKVGLDDDLAADNSDFTVFAPTNAAFVALLEELDVNGLDDIPNEVLTEVLLYHVVAGGKKASMIESGYYSSLSSGPSEGYTLSFYVDMTMGKINDRASIIQTDIEADNGIIHVIDKVILPMSITDHAVANKSFSSLVAAVTKAELAATLDNDEGMFTVFAPVNDAFSMFLNEANVSLDDLSKEALTPILLYHVMGSVVPASMVEAGYFPTLGSAFENNISVKVDVDNGVMLNSMSNVVASDVVATNGIIHAIDKVIVPPTIVDIASQNSNFSTLVSALVKAELVDALLTEGPFTVFAPTNQAFEDLFAALEITGLDDLTKEDLTPILLAHVVSANALSTGLSNGNVPTLNTTKSIMVNVDNGVTIDGDVNVVAADVQGTNGIVHVIDKVIVP